MTSLLDVHELSCVFRAGRGQRVHAVDGVSFSVGVNQTVALVGESGCGKSTTGRAALRLIEPTSGRVTFDSVDLSALRPSELRRKRSDMQIVLQDPRGQLNPRLKVKDLVAEPLRAHKIGSRAERQDRVREQVELVGLGDRFLDRYPHQLSGGQRQRVGIARALAPDPKLVVCDEAVSALDVSVQTQVLNLLNDLRDRLDVSYLFISHSLAAVRYIADRVVVMYLGQVMEEAPADEFFAGPAHPYSQALLSAVPRPVVGRRERIVVRGDVPSPFDPPSGCVFHPRCPMAQQVCIDAAPPRVEISPGRHASCHFV